MALETASYVANLVITNPDGGDQRSTADDHLRLIKAALTRTFPNLDAAVSLSASQVMYLNDLSASVQLQINQLRDGTATANNAINSRYANSASTAANVGTIPAARVADLTAENSFTGRNQSFSVLGSQGIQVGRSSSNYGAFGCNVKFHTGNYQTYLVTDAAMLFQFHSGGVTFYHAASGTIDTTISFSTVFSTTAGTITGTITDAQNATTATSAGTATTATSASTATFASTCTSASSAATLAGLAPSTAATASTIAQRDGNGYLFAQYLNQSSGAESPSVGHIACMTNLDGYWRVVSVANAGAYISGRNISDKSGITKTLSSSAPSGGSNGDIWYQYS